MPNELPAPVRVRYADGAVELSGSVQQRLIIGAEDLLQKLPNRIDERSIDLLCIAAGVYALDRITKRKKLMFNNTGIRTFVVCFHVVDASYWGQSAVVDRVSDLLHFLSGDHWLVSFASDERSSHEQQESLPFTGTPLPSRIALYSGGLDSAAGLACQLSRGQKELLILTVGQQSANNRNCMDQIADLRCLFRQSANLYHANFDVHLEHAQIMRRQEQSQRTRGFLFCVAAAIVANAWGLGDIDLFENGPGAINLPLVSGSLSDGLSTRGSHPAFLQKMAAFVSDALKTDIAYNLPFIGMTKAEMIAEVATLPFVGAWLQRSRSCVHTSWREPGITHCGRCPACIERRQAFLAAGVSETLTHYSKDIFKLNNPLRDDYLRTYLDNAMAWSRGEARVHSRLADHMVLTDMDQLSLSDLEGLYKRHASETLSVYGHLIDGWNADPSNNSNWRVAA